MVAFFGPASRLTLPPAMCALGGPLAIFSFNPSKAMYVLGGLGQAVGRHFFSTVLKNVGLGQVLVMCIPYLAQCELRATYVELKPNTLNLETKGGRSNTTEKRLKTAKKISGKPLKSGGIRQKQQKKGVVKGKTTRPKIYPKIIENTPNTCKMAYNGSEPANCLFSNRGNVLERPSVTRFQALPGDLVQHPSKKWPSTNSIGHLCFSQLPPTISFPLVQTINAAVFAAKKGAGTDLSAANVVPFVHRSIALCWSIC